ncbi:PLP-dependent aminotransferase family protein [Parasphingopyxis lamellibrachiae]|uniref:GntR family transcriptional regulator n=1 Tax=Parasphingopyxis lamellibrachiae TaxID=680125 RepID=A0A3D9FI15_9SPHN|nr:PLP-dependent aminotransferase family protein [Parasphingopyxis lamellibrachiae]RED17430.1 GntR family transcriptional regulator [Parasphingopyxis lamellibrachiae]
MQSAGQKWVPEIATHDGPIYLSISGALAHDIESGRLRPGDRLPPQRDLAETLGVDLGTVTRAYSEARRLGLIDAAGRRGSFVRDGTNPKILAEIAPFDTGMNLPPIPANSSLADRYSAAIQSILQGDAAANRLQYQPSGGAPADRQAGAGWLSEQGMEASEDTVLVVSGAQTGLHAIANSLLEEGETVCCGPSVYPGWLSICRRRKLQIAPLAADEHGIDPESFSRACTTSDIRALYTVPTNDNPTTATLPQDRRERIVAIAREHDVAIIEDAPYCSLATDRLPSFAQLAPERTWHVSSLSKIISPALRIAYLRAPTLREALLLTADAHETTIMPPPLNMAACTQWLLDGSWRELVNEIRTECLARQEIVDGILPPGSYRAARAGYHLWIPVKEGTSPFELVNALQPLGVSAVSGEAFWAQPGIGERAIRLSIGGSLGRDRLERALTMLDAMLHHRAGRASPLV